MLKRNGGSREPRRVVIVANKVLTGRDAKLYYGVAGSSATTLAGNVKDCTLAIEIEEEDVSDRESDLWGVVVPTSIKGTIDFQMNNFEGNAFAAMIINAAMNLTPIAIKCLDKVGGNGLDCDCMVSKCTRNEKLKSAQTYDVTLKPTKTDRIPKWV